MGNYIAYLEQDGEGCDYTIGCGNKLLRLKSTNYASAAKKLKQIVYEDYNYPETKLKTAMLWRASEEVYIPIRDWYEEFDKMEKESQQEQQEALEKEEYLRLKAKFETK